MSLQTPLELAFGQYMAQFYAQLVADTPAMQEFVARGLPKSIVWVPGRMIDAAEDMLNDWRKNDNNEAEPGPSAMLPVMMVCMSKDFTPSMADFGVAVGVPLDVVNPADPHQRNFKVRTSVNDYRVQIAIFAAERHTAHSLAMQFHLWANGTGGRRFKHVHQFAGSNHSFPALLEQIDLGAVNSPSEQKNLTILLVDINLRASIPIFQAPKADEPNDGKPAPAGYPVTLEVNVFDSDNFVHSHTDANGTEFNG